MPILNLRSMRIIMCNGGSALSRRSGKGVEREKQLLVEQDFFGIRALNRMSNTQHRLQ
jgi:hypothetical protein